MDQTKQWWNSKTVWVNLLAICGTVALSYGLDENSWVEISTTLLAVINLGLRFVTKTQLT